MKKKLLTLVILAGFASCQNEDVNDASVVEARDPNTVYDTDPPAYDPNQPSNTGKMTYLDWETKEPITGAKLTAKTALFGNYTITANDFIWPTIVGSTTVYSNKLDGWANLGWQFTSYRPTYYYDFNQIIHPQLKFATIGSYWGPWGMVMNYYWDYLVHPMYNTSPYNSKNFINVTTQLYRNTDTPQPYDVVLIAKVTGKNSVVYNYAYLTYDPITHKITSALTASPTNTPVGINSDGNLVLGLNLGTVKTNLTYGVNGDIKGMSVGVNGGTASSLYNYNSPNDHSYQVTYQNQPWKVEVKGGVNGQNKFYGSGAVSNGGITGQVTYTPGMIGGSINVAIP